LPIFLQRLLQTLQRTMLSVIRNLRRLALSVEQRDTLPHGSHEGFVGLLELLRFLLFFGLAASGLRVVTERTQHARQLATTFFLEPQRARVWGTEAEGVLLRTAGT